MKKTQIIAALTAKGIECSEANSLAELRALAAEHGIDVTEKGPEETAPAPKERIVIFLVGNDNLRTSCGVAAPRSRVRLKESDARLQEERGRGKILGYA